MGDSLWLGGTVSSSRAATDGPRGDSLWQGAVAVGGPGGPCILPRMVRGDLSWGGQVIV